MERELEVALKAARDAANAIRVIYDSEAYRVEQKSGGRGPLTDADLASNRILLTALAKAFPEDGLLSEESRDDRSRLERSRVWIVDPLDGTREFTLGVPEFVVSVALVQDERPVLGVLHNPATGEVITGVEGRGVTYSGEPAHTTHHPAIEGARFLVSRSEHGKGWFEPYEGIAKLTPMGSVAYKLGLVAVGRAEATFTPKPRNEWDLAAGVACVLAGGGRATNGAGEPYRFNQPDPLHIGVCGTNGALHDAVLGMMRR
ncbi:MAG: 3'(2'),5'-bisphosphate nucleotidase CysQ [Deltaproteobacteria bacterium]|nr:3'(2'),5'-bisphosphate nucleotidase CysQ [Deltaproteobacteria bacterium]